MPRELKIVEVGAKVIISTGHFLLEEEGGDKPVRFFLPPYANGNWLEVRDYRLSTIEMAERVRHEDRRAREGLQRAVRGSARVIVMEISNGSSQKDFRIDLYPSGLTKPEALLLELPQLDCGEEKYIVQKNDAYFLWQGLSIVGPQQVQKTVISLTDDRRNVISYCSGKENAGKNQEVIFKIGSKARTIRRGYKA